MSAFGRPLAAVAFAAALAVACASPGAPPGGPEDHAAPVILKVTPDSGATGVRAKNVTVTFNEVVSERPRTGNDLGAVMLLSPSDGEARVDWHRTSISVRPHREFRPNTAYSLTIVPGLSDLRGNAVTRARTFVFSTGASIPHGIVRGAVFDWTTVRPAPNALIDATAAGGDTTFRWIALADSSGRYALPFLPAGKYKLRTIIDANRNGRLDPREPWDSVTVEVADSVRLDLYAFAHDTLGPRIIGVDVKDSVTLRLTFDRPLALDADFGPEQVQLRRADSSLVGVRSITRATAFDSLARVRADVTRDSAMRADTTAAGRRALAQRDTARVIAQRDSIERARVEARRAARDTVRRVPPPVPGRVAITAEFIALLGQPIPPGDYRLIVHDVLSVSRVRRTSERTFTRAKAAVKPPAADSSAGKGAGLPSPTTKPPATPIKPPETPLTKPPATPLTKPPLAKPPPMPAPR